MSAFKTKVDVGIPHVQQLEMTIDGHKRYVNIVEPQNREMLLIVSPDQANCLACSKPCIFSTKKRVNSVEEIKANSTLLVLNNEKVYAQYTFCSNLCSELFVDSLRKSLDYKLRCYHCGKTSDKPFRKIGMILKSLPTTMYLCSTPECISGFKKWFSRALNVDRKTTIACSYCRAVGVKLLTCSGCNINLYCNKDCQKKDWKAHKATCSTAT